MFAGKEGLLKKLKVLGVESQNYDLSTTKYYLEDLGVEVETACDGISAIGLVSQQSYDLIFIDLVMVKKEAFDLLAYFKKNKAIASVPIIVVSNEKKDDDIDLALDLGASDYITQPIDPAALSHKLMSHLKYKSDSWQDIPTHEEERTALLDSIYDLEILGVNRSGLTVKSNCRFKSGREYMIESHFLSSIKLSDKNVLVSSCIKVGEVYYSKLKFKGLNRRESRRLEKFVFRNQAS